MKYGEMIHSINKKCSTLEEEALCSLISSSVISPGPRLHPPYLYLPSPDPKASILCNFCISNPMMDMQYRLFPSKLNTFSSPAIYRRGGNLFSSFPNSETFLQHPLSQLKQICQMIFEEQQTFDGMQYHLERWTF